MLVLVTAAGVGGTVCGITGDVLLPYVSIRLKVSRSRGGRYGAVGYARTSATHADADVVSSVDRTSETAPVIPPCHPYQIPGSCVSFSKVTWSTINPSSFVGTVSIALDELATVTALSAYVIFPGCLEDRVIFSSFYSTTKLPFERSSFTLSIDTVTSPTTSLLKTTESPTPRSSVPVN